MRILGRIVFLIFLLLGAIFAISNRQSISIGIWPLADTLEMPLFLLVPVLLAIGAMVGLLLGWLAGANQRRNLRSSRRELERLRNDCETLRNELSARSNAMPLAKAALDIDTVERRSLERQAALVDPHQVIGGRVAAEAVR